jgi:UDP-N-acetylmuramoylalanine-D-glutamate ligase
MDLTGQNVAVLGAGRSGGAAARLALRLGASVTVYDVAGDSQPNLIPRKT